MEIEQLPDSLLLQVFKHLMFGDVCTCARVCRRWRRVAGDRTLRRVVNALSTPLSVRQAFSLVRVCGGPHLVELRITGRRIWYYTKTKQHNTFTPKFFRHLGHSCPSLKVLYVENAHLVSNSTTRTATFADLPKTLVKLSLRDSFFHPAEFFQSNPSQPALPCLRLLDLGHCTSVSNIDLRELGQLRKLEVLCLEYCCRVKDGGIAYMDNVLANLVILDIEGTQITDRGLFTVLTCGIHLKCLLAGHTRITGEAFGEVLPYIRHRSESRERLICMCLRRTLVTEGHLAELVEVAPRLVYMDVTSPYLSADTKARLEQSVSKSYPFWNCGATFKAEGRQCAHYRCGII